MIRRINHWALQRVYPTFDDRESLTVLDLVGKNTTKINEIIDIVNNFIDDVNLSFENFTNETNKNYEAFRIEMNQKIKDFTDITELKLASQDKDITDAINYMKNNLVNTVHDLLIQMFDTNELTLNFEYDTNTESLNIIGVVVNSKEGN